MAGTESLVRLSSVHSALFASRHHAAKNAERKCSGLPIPSGSGPRNPGPRPRSCMCRVTRLQTASSRKCLSGTSPSEASRVLLHSQSCPHPRQPGEGLMRLPVAIPSSLVDQEPGVGARVLSSRCVYQASFSIHFSSEPLTSWSHPGVSSLFPSSHWLEVLLRVP